MEKSAIIFKKTKNLFVSARDKIINTFLNLFMNEIGNSNKRKVIITGEIKLKALIPYCTIFHFYRTVSVVQLEFSGRS